MCIESCFTVYLFIGKITMTGEQISYTVQTHYVLLKRKRVLPVYMKVFFIHIVLALMLQMTSDGKNGKFEQKSLHFPMTSSSSKAFIYHKQIASKRKFTSHCKISIRYHG